MELFEDVQILQYLFLLGSKQAGQCYPHSIYHPTANLSHHPCDHVKQIPVSTQDGDSKEGLYDLLVGLHILLELTIEKHIHSL